MYDGEKLNAWTHVVGAALALGGSIVLITLAVLQGDPWKLLSFSIYSVTLVLLYSASAIYHSLRGRAKHWAQKLDHLSIYLLIAGSYTPFCLVSLRQTWGPSLLALVWGLALVGSVQELLRTRPGRAWSMVIYLVMGWVVLVASWPLLEALGVGGFLWVASGGVLYTLGIFFYAGEARLAHAHGIWHLFVLAGSATHYVAIIAYVR